MPTRVRRQATLQQVDAIDDPLLAASAIASFDVPTLWTPRPYGSVVAPVAEILGDLAAYRAATQPHDLTRSAAASIAPRKRTAPQRR
jgi:hypothetical protein